MFGTVSQMFFASGEKGPYRLCAQTVAALAVWAYSCADCGGSSLMAQSSPTLLNSGRVKKFHGGTRKQAASYKAVYTRKKYKTHISWYIYYTYMIHTWYIYDTYVTHILYIYYNTYVRYTYYTYIVHMCYIYDIYIVHTWYISDTHMIHTWYIHTWYIYNTYMIHTWYMHDT